MPDVFNSLLDFLDDLRSEGIVFRLNQVRSETIMVEVFVPRERWEVEFFADGSIEVDRYVGAEGVRDDSSLGYLWSVIRDAPAVENFGADPRA